MPLSIRIISSPDGESISQWNYPFPEDGGEIGRAFGSTLELMDASRTISGKHASIRKINRGYQIEDTSSNGLFINGAMNALGKGNQATLNDGDVLDVGPYRLQVSCFIPAEATARPIEQASDNLSYHFSDDPFYKESTNLQSTNQMVAFEPSLDQATLSDEQLLLDMEKALFWGDDPFFNRTSQKSEEKVGLDLNFSLSTQEKEEDPFEESEFSSELIKIASISTEVSKARTKNMIKKRKANSAALLSLERDKIIKKHRKAIDLAMDKLLNELEPDSLEFMFNDYVRPRWYQAKPNFWALYKRYFTRQVQLREWHIKFQAYFLQAMDEMQLVDGDE